MKKIYLFILLSLSLFASTDVKLGYAHYDNNDFDRTTVLSELISIIDLNSSITDSVEFGIQSKHETTNSVNKIDRFKIYSLFEKNLDSNYGFYYKPSYNHNPFDGYENQYRLGLGAFYVPLKSDDLFLKLRLGYVNSKELYTTDEKAVLNLARFGYIFTKKLDSNIRFKSQSDADIDVSTYAKYLESTNSLIFDINKRISFELTHEYTWTSKPILDTNKPREINILTNLVFHF